MEQKSNVQYRAEKEYKNSREKFFLLLREIISNAIHAVLIRESKEKDYVPELNLNVVFDEIQCKIELTDNGEGFNEKNRKYFEELDKKNSEKEKLNFHPLGQGRLAIVYFADSAEYETVYKDETGKYRKKMQENNIILYQDDNEITRVSVRFADEDLWLTQNQLADIYCTTQQNISQHVDNIYKDGELTIEATNKKFLLVRQEGNRQVKRNIDHYNLDMIIALGYRVQSQVATRFRRWATQRLHEYIQKGFAMDDERLKQGGNRYFRELLQRIRDIRSSERNFYQQVTDIYATATDYDPRDEMTKIFFATVQNKLHYAVHENTAAEVIYNRVDNEKPFVGMTNFKGNYVTKDDVKIAKNYLSEIELQRLNLLVSGFLDFAEFQALEMNPMTMKDWIEALDNQIIAHKRKVLIGKGNISHKQAIEKAEKEFEIYRKREMELLESDFDKEIKRFKDK